MCFVNLQLVNNFEDHGDTRTVFIRKYKDYVR